MVKIFHGKITPQDFANSLITHFNRGNFRVQQIGSGLKINVQIATAQQSTSGGKTATSVFLQQVEDGVSVQIGKQAWFGLAASLGSSALAALRNPWLLLDRLDDLAQDYESIQLSDDIWNTLEQTAHAFGAGYELSSRLRRSVCEFCGTANPIGEPACIACGAPFGYNQPVTCKKCGYVVKDKETICPNCGSAI